MLHCTCRVFEAINGAHDLFLMMAEWQTARLVLYGVFSFYFSQNPHLTTAAFAEYTWNLVPSDDKTCQAQRMHLYAGFPPFGVVNTDECSVSHATKWALY